MNLSRFLPSGVRGRLFFLIFLTLLPVLGLLGWMFRKQYVTGYERMGTAEIEVATGIAIAFDGYISNIRDENFALGEALVLFSPSDTESISRLLVRAAARYRAARSLDWVDPDGIIIASSRQHVVGADLSYRQYFRELTEGDREWMVSDILETGLGMSDPVFTVASAIRDESGKLHGVVVAALDPLLSGRIVLPESRPSEGAYTIFDSQGHIVYRNPELPLTWEERESWRGGDQILRRVLETGSATSGVTALERMESSWLVARVPAPGTGWIAGAGHPESFLLEPLFATILQGSLITLSVFVFAFLLSYLIAMTISEPLRKLARDALEFGSMRGVFSADPLAPREVYALREKFMSVFIDLADRAEAVQKARGELERLNGMLEERIRERTAKLETALKELEAFSYSVSHDLRSPLRSIDGFSKLLLEKHAGSLDERGADYLLRIRAAAQRMGRLIDDLLGLSRIGRRELRFSQVDLAPIAQAVLAELRERDPSRRVEMLVAPSLPVSGDGDLLRIVLENLIGNAWKFTGKQDAARIEVGETTAGGERVFFVRDNGAGFEMDYADKLFSPFQRLHTEQEFPGTGIGLATVARIISRHGGRFWAEGEPSRGATVFFTLSPAV